MKRPALITLSALALFLMGASGFDFSKHSIPTGEIQGGGPAKDAIPSLTDPKFVVASEADYLEDSDRVIGMVVSGEAKAYPIKILNWHEGVNDELGGLKYLVTW